MEVLSIDNLNKSYSKKVLDNISFKINQGEVVGLVGPNGVGKTTLMKIICNLGLQDSGCIKICGVDSKDKGEKKKQYLSSFSCVIENPALYEELSGYENIEFIRKLNKIPKESMEEMLEFVGIGNMIKKKVKFYSLGMKQRLALAICLITSPKLLILDEPTNGLDPDGSMEFRKMLNKLSQEKHIAVLISSHILSELDKTCSRILFLKDGNIVQCDVKEVRENNKKILISTKENMEVLKKIFQGEEVGISSKSNGVYCIRLKKEKVSNAVKLLADSGIEYDDITIVADDVSDLYNSVFGGGEDEVPNMD
ncbi:ABC-2 type transport system ATP-binding protein [Hathewaya proteolytica DSM 3090]|uniref:ABC-2 type transport system ATP-binding protein n=1 Tax=Hathewaya proteolytica DSM 3090 TaxID=1121331 RepID=A0A1M6P5G2_9CLOT|nr:ABC transporter ATP-binding protein [Hathewaya proteolytica]SHK03150.1 ABC-2 type transport system ATP-binding protein [Hathewaya proteolytica DSM 3090]